MNLQTQAEYAIAKFESRSSGFSGLKEENLNFTHWDDIINKILDIWFSKYENHLQLCNNNKEFDDLIKKYKSEINKIFSKKPDYVTYKRYYEYVIDFQVNLMKNELLAIDFEQKENSEKITEKLKTLKLAQVKLPEPVVKPANKLLTPLMFNLTHMMRCHSKQNDPNDNNSQVTSAAFEIATWPNSFDQLPSYTDMFAACGQNMINLIDASTGKVLQRFNDDLFLNQSKEIYNCMAWTILGGTSVLAAAGKHGQIKLIIPKHSVCLSRIDAHKTEITSVVFHPKYPNILLSSSDDHEIKLWRLNYVESATCIECELSFEKLAIIEYESNENKSKRERVSSMCFVSNDVLVISTELMNYAVHLSQEKLFNHFEETQEKDMNTMTNEEMVNYLMTKPQEKNKVFTAKKLIILSYTSNETPFEDSFIASKTLFINGLLIAFIANSEMIYVIRMDFSNMNNIISHVISHIRLADHKNEFNSYPSFFKNNDLDRYTLLRPTPNGLFEYFVLNSETTNLNAALRYHIPAEYTIKNQKDLTKIPVKDYNLLEKAKVLAIVSNGNFIIATTNQNLITIWSK